ncbi:hypothetical protein ABEF95_017258 [Exophiala dermatitidis]
MASVGPQLPPELQNRKRSHEDDDDRGSDSESSDSSTGPLPPKAQEKEQSPPSAKRKRVYGPTLPPAPLDEEQHSASSPPRQLQRDGEDDRPEHSSTSDDDDDDDDDFGPSLPSANDRSSASIGPTSSSTPGASVSEARAGPVQRDEWMTLAPTGGDWSARVDPTKLKNRKFNTGRGAKGPPQAAGGGGGGTSSSWYETPEEKQARLRREVMGISNDSATAAGGGKSKAEGTATHGDDAETARRLKEYNEKRGPSLYAAHNASSKVAEEDDPSARAFDREKDIAGGATINATKRREMLKKASDFSSRFSSAKYL